MTHTEKQLLSLILMFVQCYGQHQPLAKNDFLQKTMYKIQRERLGIKHEDSNVEAEQTTDNIYQNLQEDIEGEASHIEQSYDPEEQPISLSLTKDQLLALYNAALNKGSKLQLDHLPNFHQPHHDDDTTLIQSTEQGQIPGYYYYFYPIKSFMNEMMKDADTSETKNKEKDKDHKDMLHEEIPKTIEPLFAAMASFVGVAMMFIMTILFFPKLGALKSRRIIFKESSDDFATFTKVLTESIQGNDCSLKIACHVGKTLRNMHMGTNTIKILELMLPENLAKQLARIRRSATKKEKCHYIKCKSVKNTQRTDR